MLTETKLKLTTSECMYIVQWLCSNEAHTGLWYSIYKWPYTMNQLCYIMITVGFSVFEPLRLTVLATAAEGVIKGSPIMKMRIRVHDIISHLTTIAIYIQFASVKFICLWPAGLEGGSLALYLMLHRRYQVTQELNFLIFHSTKLIPKLQIRLSGSASQYRLINYTILGRQQLNIPREVSSPIHVKCLCKRAKLLVILSTCSNNLNQMPIGRIVHLCSILVSETALVRTGYSTDKFIGIVPGVLLSWQMREASEILANHWKLQYDARRLQNTNCFSSDPHLQPFGLVLRGGTAK